MLAALFSFRGRVNRLQYLIGNIAVFGAVLLLAVMLSALLDLPASTAPSFALGVDAAMLVLGAALVLWIGASLQVRRLRDIGCGPALAVPAWLGVVVVAALVTQGAPQSQVAIGTAINFAVVACLFGWPGKRGGFRALSYGGTLSSFAPVASPASARRSSLIQLGR
ncbi:MAG TPA: DUF805 domain-containing protein [Caulobacteraceae bacterium]|jgi:uncharacterized membrane protein YhaH (DUF805 family)|nr:DUF805 domain-containing protein [Caulobacteraceae bacterium]